MSTPTPPTLPKHRAPTGFSLPEAHQSAELWVVRHGESTWNASGLYQGQSDVPLSGMGILQASYLAERLTGQEFAAVYSSDLVRARHTAEIVAERLTGSPTVQIDTGLREIDVGELGGLSITEIKARYPDYVAALQADSWATRRPGGESMADLYVRSAQSMQAIMQRHTGQRVLIFTHGGVVRVAVGLALGGVPQNAWSRLSVTNTSITRILLGDGDGAAQAGTLLGFNDSAHLESLQEAGETDDLSSLENTP